MKLSLTNKEMREYIVEYFGRGIPPQNIIEPVEL